MTKKEFELLITEAGFTPYSKAIAEELGVNPRTVRHWLTVGEFPRWIEKRVRDLKSRE